jgi:hypothetical protein
MIRPPGHATGPGLAGESGWRAARADRPGVRADQVAFRGVRVCGGAAGGYRGPQVELTVGRGGGARRAAPDAGALGRAGPRRHGARDEDRARQAACEGAGKGYVLASAAAGLAFFYSHAPGLVSLPILIKVAAKRWPAEKLSGMGKGDGPGAGEGRPAGAPSTGTPCCPCAPSRRRARWHHYQVQLQPAPA